MMNDTNLQTWKVPFVAELWKNNLTHAIINKSYDMVIGDLTIHLEPLEKEKIFGYFLFQFNNEKNSVNDAENTADDIKQNKFESFRQILLLQGIYLDIKWGRIESVGLPQDHRFAVSKSVIFSHKILEKPILLHNTDIQDFEKIHKKFQSHPQKEYLVTILNLLTMKTSNERENFFYKWISFNQIYRPEAESEKDAIEKFSLKYSAFPESSDFGKHREIFSLLSEKEHFNKNKDKNYSLKLQDALSKNNIQDIWKYTFLCIYSIRNEFFHEGRDQTEFSISSFLSEIVLNSLNNIFELK